MIVDPETGFLCGHLFGTGECHTAYADRCETSPMSRTSSRTSTPRRSTSPTSTSLAVAVAAAVAVAVVGSGGQLGNGSARSERGGFAQWVNHKARKS